MTHSTSPDIYSENSVFRKLFTEDPKLRHATKAERMADIFADAQTTEPEIKVQDFLPVY